MLLSQIQYRMYSCTFLCGWIRKAPHSGYSLVKHCYISCRCLNQMEKDGLSVDDIFSQCVFRQDERDMVLRAVHIIQPDYHPSRNANANECLPALVQGYYVQVSQAGILCYMGCFLQLSNS